jgi:DNA (cytosine-5)-methyltransferase 1
MTSRPAPLSERMPAAVEEFALSPGGMSVRSVSTRHGTVITTAMGRTVARAGEEAVDRAERAFLEQASRPTAGLGRQVRLADLYSGCGGLSLGVEEACRAVGRRFVAVGAFDNDPVALDAYRTNFPTSKLWCDDVSELFSGRLAARTSWTERKIATTLRELDFLVAGPPCQGWSSLNNHTRGFDSRNGLYRRVARAAEITEPRYIVIENVASARLGRAPSETRTFLQRLGYAVCERVVSLADIGVPQRRRRHVVVATREAPLDLDAALAALSRKPRTLRWAIGDLTNGGPNEPEFDRSSSPSVENARRMRWLREHRAYDLPNRYRPACHHGDHTYRSVYGRLRWNLPAQTITTGFGSMGQGRYVHPGGRRTLTPHEAARLQYFPDWFRFGPRTRSELSTLIGNAVPMKLSYAIALWLLR